MLAEESVNGDPGITEDICHWVGQLCHSVDARVEVGAGDTEVHPV